MIKELGKVKKKFRGGTVHITYYILGFLASPYYILAITYYILRITYYIMAFKIFTYYILRNTYYILGTPYYILTFFEPKNSVLKSFLDL